MCLGQSQLVCRFLWPGSPTATTAHMSGEASCLSGPVPSLGCVLHAAQYPDGEHLTYPKRGQKKFEVPPCHLSSSTLPKVHLVSEGPLYAPVGSWQVFQQIRQCRAPLNSASGDSQQLQLLFLLLPSSRLTITIPGSGQ